MTARDATLVDRLRRHAERTPDRRAYTFPRDGESDEVHLSCRELDEQARAVAALLQERSARGERAILLYPPGLEFIPAFLGCLNAQVAAVPVYPPDPFRLGRTLPRLQAITRDARPAVILTESLLFPLAEQFAADAPDLAAVEWIDTSGGLAGREADWRDPGIDPASLAMIQYTSGSTATPKGVQVTNANLWYNEPLIQTSLQLSEESVAVSWLPVYHDMGLIGHALQPLFTGFPAVLLPPIDFLLRPWRWLAAVTHYRGTISSAPNFAYDLCVRKVTPEEREGLELSRWNRALNGSEPGRAETLERFLQTFGPYGFCREALHPVLGLAEATLFVSGAHPSTAPLTLAVSANGLAHGVIEPIEPESKDCTLLVACREPPAGIEIAVVDPVTRADMRPGRTGEIWLGGPTVAVGYWERPEETRETFEARGADGSGPFLRTGDLGFVAENQLFITGRLKDLIIIRGRNHYPQDIEATAAASHPAVRRGAAAAFSIVEQG
jgi:acyl-CoA synthetase (AMP-forming)/AMP-acid ligase II